MISRKTLYRLTFFVVAAFASLILAGCDDGPKPMKWPGIPGSYIPPQAQTTGAAPTPQVQATNSTPSEVSGPMQKGPDGTYQMTATEKSRVIETSDADKIWHGLRKTENYASELLKNWYIVLIILFCNPLLVLGISGIGFGRAEKPFEGLLAMCIGLFAAYQADMNNAYWLMVLALVCNVLFGAIMLVWGIASKEESGKWTLVSVFSVPIVLFILAVIAHWVFANPIWTAVIVVAFFVAAVSGISKLGKANA